MRKLVASAVTAIAALTIVPAVHAADMIEYPDIEIPDVDYDMGGSFYLRGSAALNLHWAKEVEHAPGWGGVLIHPIDENGFGYSWGAGFGYETGDGLRFDATIDALETRGVSITKNFANGIDVDGKYTLMLRSTVALANVYYDFGLGGGGGGFGYSGGGGAFGYVGVGAGVAWNTAAVNGPGGFPHPQGGNVSGAAAVMAGVGYDMGKWVADVGYRGLYINQINNSPTDPVLDPGLYYHIDNNFIHEVRGTIRYRFD